MENAEKLQLNRFGEPDRVLSRGHGHGISARTERYIRAARGFPEGIIEAWGNLYTEFAMAVAGRRDCRKTPRDWIELPRVQDGADGVRFIEASVQSDRAGGTWVEI